MNLYHKKTHLIRSISPARPTDCWGTVGANVLQKWIIRNDFRDTRIFRLKHSKNPGCFGMILPVQWKFALFIIFRFIFPLASPLGIQPQISSDVCKNSPNIKNALGKTRQDHNLSKTCLCEISIGALAAECPGVLPDRDCLRRIPWN